MRGALIGFAIGAAILQNQAALPGTTALLLMFCAAAFLLFLPLKFRAQFPNALCVALRVASGMVFGMFWAALLAQHTLSQELPKPLEGRDLVVVGTVDSLPYHFDQGVRFNFAVERAVDADGAAVALPPKLALSWYAPLHTEDMQATVGDVQPGARWQLNLRLQRPHGNANPYGFDYEAWLLEQGVRATGAVRPDADSAQKNARLDDFVPSFGNAVERSRGWLRQRILAALPDKPYAAVIVALVVGDQRAVPQSDWKVFNRTGIGHLISISGLHITMVAGMFAALVFWLWRRSFFMRAQLPLLLPAQKAAALAGAAAALVYVLLAGFGVPAQRTLYMLSVVAAALWFDRLASVSHVLCLALGVVVALDPWAVLWPGFWLSFGAVAVILYTMAGRSEQPLLRSASRPQRWKEMLLSAARTQYAVTLGLVPLTMLLFGQVSVAGPIANAVAIPLVSFIVTPLALVGAVAPAPFSAWLLGMAHWFVERLAQFLGWLSSFDFAAWSAPIPPCWMFLLAFIGMLWMLAPRGWPSRWLGLFLWLPLLLNAPERPAPGMLWVTAFDVGQGMALLVETSQHRLLYDTGPAYSPESDGGNRVIVPYLKARGIDRLDTMVISHSDSDHSGGALSILDEMRVASVTSSLWPDHPVVKASPQHRRCEAGQRWSWDGVQFEMLHPMAVSYDSQKWKPNARGCTLKITLGTQSILLPGDIEAVQETELLERAADQLHATILLAPHHGSGTSSTQAFLDAVKPELALFQVGYRNRYHHPKPEVFERYGQMGIRRLRSDESGALALQLDATGYSVVQYRIDHPRYWYGR